MLKKFLDKVQQCIVERRLPCQARIDRFLSILPMRIETMLFNLGLPALEDKRRVCQKKYLYAAPVGAEGKELFAKLISKFGHQDFDYLIFVWDDTCFDEDVFARCQVIHEKGYKWFFIKKYLTPEFCKKYSYLFLWDDDLDVEYFNYQDFIAIMKENKLQVAQPALSEDSYFSHPITLRQKDKVGRYVDFVEIMAQVFRADAWPVFWQLIESDRNFWGFGYDTLARTVCSYTNMGIIDSQFVKHVRPCRNYLLAAMEGNTFMRKFSAKALAKHVSYGRLKQPGFKPHS